MEHLCAGEQLASCLEPEGDTEGCGGADNMAGPWHRDGAAGGAASGPSEAELGC